MIVSRQGFRLSKTWKLCLIWDIAHDLSRQILNYFNKKDWSLGKNQVLLTHSFPMHRFMYPLKRSENLTVFWGFQGIEKGCIGKEWVKSKVKLIQSNIYHQGITKNREKFFQSLWEKSFLLKYFFSTMEVNFIAGCAVINSWVLYLIPKIYAILIFFMKC